MVFTEYNLGRKDGSVAMTPYFSPCARFLRRTTVIALYLCQRLASKINKSIYKSTWHLKHKKSNTWEAGCIYEKLLAGWSLSRTASATQLHRDARPGEERRPGQWRTQAVPTSSASAEEQPPKEGRTDRCAHTSLPGEPYRAHAELRPRQRGEAGRGKLTRGSLLGHQEKHVSAGQPRSGIPGRTSPQPRGAGHDTRRRFALVSSARSHFSRSGRFWAPGFDFSNWSPGKKKKKSERKSAIWSRGGGCC